tara:strand:+ start:541 stop:756 length:216 start_codon:yes stop_codon:yes gene_type:complete
LSLGKQPKGFGGHWQSTASIIQTFGESVSSGLQRLAASSSGVCFKAIDDLIETVSPEEQKRNDAGVIVMVD